MIITKQCCNCKKSKPLLEFYKAQKSKDGHQSICKKCMAEYGQRWARSNPGKRQEIKCRWEKNNPGKQREYERRYRETHPKRIQEKDRRYRATNKEHLQLRERRRYNDDPERAKERSRRYRARQNAASGNFTEVQFVELCNRYNNRCLRCGRGNVPLTRDHVIPLSEGGTHSIENIQPLCGLCNSRKGTKSTDYREVQCLIS